MRWTAEEDQVIVDFFPENGIDVMLDKLNRTAYAINKRANIINVRKTDEFMATLNRSKIIQYSGSERKYIVNDDFFETINTEAKAYILGFIWADGCVHKVSENSYKMSIGIKDSDVEILEIVTREMESTFPIKFYSQAKNHDCCVIHITSKKIYDDLHKYGITQQKTKDGNIPTNVPNEYLHHFIRGFFDGDGSIVVRKPTFYPKICFATSIEVCGWLDNIFDGGIIYKKVNSDICYSFDLNGRDKCKNFYNKVYNNATIYLQRKYNRFSEVQF